MPEVAETPWDPKGYSGVRVGWKRTAHTHAHMLTHSHTQRGKQM